jgi:hypothetical protein
MKDPDPKVDGEEAAGEAEEKFSDGPPDEPAEKCKSPASVHAFGNTAGPRPPRIQGVNTAVGQKADLVPNAAGNLEPPTPEQLANLDVKGASTFADPSKAPIGGHHHVLPEGTEMPEGLGIIADGKDVGGAHGATHHTIYPTREMPASEFLQKFNDLPWQYAGKKK